ncbi:MAG: chitobiase/beta-hexosaminidase C-terminal domain-containing protein [Breznakibacter sp.]|nr:chitobiase/beta-hexosaminidase C-terminal domain-containing protein [Breznakibacter sp.]
MRRFTQKFLLIISFCIFALFGLKAQGPAAKPMATQRAFTKETIYFLLPTRFFDGDPSNNRPNEWCSYDGKRTAITDPEDVTWRGDFKGLMQQLDYIQGMGFTAIWITPVVQNAGPLDYHGYHAYDFMKVDPRLESPGATFQDLINAVHARGMKIVLDIVTNHSGRYGIKGKAELKYNTDPASPWGQKSDGTPLTMPANNGWVYDGLTPNPEDGKIWSRANIPPMPAPYNSIMKNLNWPSTESFVNTSDPNWFHHSGNGFAQGWDDTENLYNRALAGDCPDLNTESQEVRDYLVAAYTKYINMGVDAFRWDTMKHMDRATVLYFRDAFAAVNPNLFIFGETAQKRHELHQEEKINPHWYTWRGAVGASENSGVAQLDFYAEATFHNVFEEGGSFSNAQSCARYDNLYADPYTNLNWLDNHDFGPNNNWNQRYGGTEENLAACMNFMFTWRGIPVVYYGTEIQFMKGAYTDLHEAADIEKSIDVTGRAYYGKKLAADQIATTKSHKIYQQIRKLNQMRSQIPALWDGDFQWGGNAPGNGIGFTRVKGSSKVCVGLAKDGAATFSFTGIDNGTWVDAVTGKSVSVSNGTLGFSCKSGGAGVYVLNGPGMIGEGGLGYFDAAVGPQAPMLSVAPGGGTYQTSQSVTLTGTPAGVTVRYTTDGSTPTTTTGTIYTTPIAVTTTNTTIKAIAYNGTGSSAVLSNTYYIVVPKPVASISPVSGKYPDPFDVTLTGSSVNMPVTVRYTLDGTTPTATTGTVYSTPINISTSKTVKAICVDSKGDVSDVVTNTYTIGLDMPVVTVTPASKTLVNGVSQSVTLAVAPVNASTKIYYTTDGTTPTSASNLYSAAFSVVGTDVVKTVKAIAVDKFSQTSAVASASYTYAPQPTGLKVYFKKPAAWSTSVKIHYWGCTPVTVAATTWPGAAMTDDGNGWYSYTIIGASAANIVFNDDGTNKTVDLTRSSVGYYDGTTATWSDAPASDVSVAMSPGTKSFSSPITVTLTASGTKTPLVVRYTLDGSTPSATNGIVYSAPLTISTTTTVKAVAIDNSNTSSSVVSNTYTYGSAPTSLIVHIKVTGYSQAPYLYAWTGTNTSLNGAWPGTQIAGSADGNGYYTFTFPAGVMSSNLIFNKGQGQGQAQTANIMDVTSEKWFTWDGNNNSAPTVDVVTSISSTKSATALEMELEPSPNPFTDIIRFKLAQEDVEINISLFNIQGQLVASESFYSATGSVDFPVDVTKGVYILKVITPTQTYTRRVVKR